MYSGAFEAPLVTEGTFEPQAKNFKLPEPILEFVLYESSKEMTRPDRAHPGVLFGRTHLALESTNSTVLPHEKITLIVRARIRRSLNIIDILSGSDVPKRPPVP